MTTAPPALSFSYVICSLLLYCTCATSSLLVSMFMTVVTAPADSTISAIFAPRIEIGTHLPQLWRQAHCKSIIDTTRRTRLHSGCCWYSLEASVVQDRTTLNTVNRTWTWPISFWGSSSCRSCWCQEQQQQQQHLKANDESFYDLNARVSTVIR